MGTVARSLKLAPDLVAVDGGANAALAWGLSPIRVVGDMDSLSDAARAAFGDRLDPVAEQDSTDLQKALRSTDAPRVIGCGFLGGRVDHTLAALTALAGERRAVVLLGEEDCVCLAPPSLALDLAAGTRASLWPLAAARGESTGLHWPLDGLDLAPDGVIGTSNRATGPVTLRLRGGPVALILPADALDRLWAALPLLRDAG